MKKTTSRWATAAIALAFVATACGGGEAGSAAASDTTPAPTEAAAPATTTTEQPTTPAEPEPAAEPTTTTEQPTTTTAAETTTTTAADQSEAEAVLPLPAAGPVEPGRYEHAMLPGLVLTTDGGLAVESSRNGLLVLDGDGLTATVRQGAIFLQTVGIIPPSEVGIHQEHHPTVPEVTVDLPDDLSIWFESISQVALIDAGELTVAGQPARWWTVTVEPEAGDTFNCGFAPNCIGFVVNEHGGAYVLTDIELHTIFQFDAAPDVIGWASGVDEPSAAEATAFLESVLAGLEAV